MANQSASDLKPSELTDKIIFYFVDHGWLKSKSFDEPVSVQSAIINISGKFEEENGGGSL